MERKKGQEKAFTWEVNGTAVPVTEEVFRVLARGAWTEHKQLERNRRCLVQNGKGKLVLCEEDCSHCLRDRQPRVLSLTSELPVQDRAQPDGFWTDLEKSALREALLREMEALDEESQQILRMTARGIKIETIAAVLGIAKLTVRRRRSKLLVHLKEKLTDFI